MIRRPPSSTRSYTLFPYPALVPSGTERLELVLDVARLRAPLVRCTRVERDPVALEVRVAVRVGVALGVVVGIREHALPVVALLLLQGDLEALVLALAALERADHVDRKSVV